jgi:EAL domain-containing protein (putative c-di-GMP-specific phosphodiesterase class I)
MKLRLSICSEVREALENNQIEPFYQPKVSLRGERLEGFEALLRWRHPDGLRSPAALMAAFDDHEIATALFRRMLDRVVADISHWRRLDLRFGHVALNTSAADYSSIDLADRVLDCLQAAGVPPSCLGIEVTETVLLGRDAELVGPALRKLSKAGISIALDDFGTGYASLSHLQEYPVDVIKIDQSFIRGIGSDAGSQAITSAVLGLGRSLGMTVIAEGVETLEQAELLRIAGCEQAQGFLFAKPLPGDEVPEFISRWMRQEDAAQRAVQAA